MLPCGLHIYSLQQMKHYIRLTVLKCPLCIKWNSIRAILLVLLKTVCVVVLTSPVHGSIQVEAKPHWHRGAHRCVDAE